jgi:hypothetical protein
LSPGHREIFVTFIAGAAAHTTLAREQVHHARLAGPAIRARFQQPLDAAAAAEADLDLVMIFPLAAVATMVVLALLAPLIRLVRDFSAALFA